MPATADGLCVNHSPAHRELIAAARAAGGTASAKPRARDVLREELERVAREQAPALLGVYTDAMQAEKWVATGPFKTEAVPDHAIRLKAADSVLDRALGKPGSTLELSGADGGPITLAALLADDARDTV